MKRWSGRLLTAGLLLALVVAVLWAVPTNEYIFLPDRARPVAPYVTVPGERPARDDGGIYYVDVIVRKATLLDRLAPWLHDGESTVPANRYAPQGATADDLRRQGREEMRRSQPVAAAVALSELGYRVRIRPTGVLITLVPRDGPASGKLQPQDVIVSVNGRRILRPQELRRAIRGAGVGATVSLTVRRGSDHRTYRLRTIADPSDPAHPPIVGVLVDQAADVSLPIKVRIDLGSVGGPSAGLAFALDVLEELGRDADHGLKVAATGTINLDGSVGPVGGIKQKTLGARGAHVDVFLVPAGENALEAARYADGLRIVPVQSFRQALRALATLGNRA